MKTTEAIEARRLKVIDEIITCERCDLYKQCRLPVPFSGPVPSDILVIAEGPGSQEDVQGRPLIGRAGQMLRKHLLEVGLDPEEMAMANTVSCYPHGAPEWIHIEACAPNKSAQIELIDPKWILLLGKVALRGQNRDIEARRIRGKAFMAGGRVNFATWHPSAALRNGDYERGMHEDLETFKAMVDDGNWAKYISDLCVECGQWAEWFPVDGLSVCLNHAPLEAKEWQPATQNAVERRDAALAAVESGADDAWMRQAWETLIRYLQKNETFFVDEFWQRTRLARPRESRALGPLVMRAARGNMIEKTGDYRKSVASNMTEKPVWRSLVYQGAMV